MGVVRCQYGKLSTGFMELEVTVLLKTHLIMSSENRRDIVFIGGLVEAENAPGMTV